MSFRFNFPSDSDSQDSKSSETVLGTDVKNRDVKDILVCDFLNPIELKVEGINDEISLINIGDLEVKYVLIKSIRMKSQNETFSQIDTLNTDIIPGKYEGGLKIWECSLDLAQYILENHCIKSGDAVLELGCGAGLPGVIAYMLGAKVTFQDFNTEVLEHVTYPNTVLNTADGKISEVPHLCRFLYGDWSDIHKKYFSDPSTCPKFDVILASETIYEKSNFRKLLELMKVALKPDGRIYLAAKIFYFGVGGGISDFEALVKEDKSFEISPVFRTKEGVERQILMLRYLNG